jgi:hypothetical protein
MSKNDIEVLNTIIDGRDSLRKSYFKPHLEMLGDLRDLTLGGSQGSGDSSNAGVQNPPQAGHHGLLVQPQGAFLPGTDPYGVTPTPDNPFKP